MKTAQKNADHIVRCMLCILLMAVALGGLAPHSVTQASVVSSISLFGVMLGSLMVAAGRPRHDRTGTHRHRQRV